MFPLNPTLSQEVTSPAVTVTDRYQLWLEVQVIDINSMKCYLIIKLVNFQVVLNLLDSQTHSVQVFCLLLLAQQCPYVLTWYVCV